MHMQRESGSTLFASQQCLKQAKYERQERSDKSETKDRNRSLSAITATLCTRTSSSDRIHWEEGYDA